MLDKMLLHRGLILLSLLFLTCKCEEDTLSTQNENSTEEYCSKDDIKCGESDDNIDEAEYNQYKHKSVTNRDDYKIHKALDEIDIIKNGNPEKAIPLIDEVLKRHPESPRALHSLLKIYITLHKEYREDSSSQAQVDQMVDNIFDVALKIVKTPSDKISSELYLNDVDEIMVFLSDLNHKNEESLDLLEELMDKAGDIEGIEQDELLDFSKQYLKYLFISGEYEQVDRILEMNTSPDSDIRYDFKFLRGLTRRVLQAIENPNKELEKDEELIADLKPKTQEDLTHLFYFTNNFDESLRHYGKTDILNIVFDLAVDLGMYPSRFQRCTSPVPGLRAKPVWTIEETGYQDKLLELQANWETIRDEGLALIASPAPNITYGEKSINPIKEKWKQFILGGFNFEPFPDHMCKFTPTTCKLLKDYSPALDCPQGTIKFSYISANAHVLPHTGGNNYRLRAHLPLVVPKSEKRVEMIINQGEHVVKWEEGKLVVFDDSFEHEVYNESSENRLILIIDLIHPDMTELQKERLKRAITYKKPEGDTKNKKHNDNHVSITEMSESDEGILFNGLTLYPLLKR